MPLLKVDDIWIYELPRSGYMAKIQIGTIFPNIYEICLDRLQFREYINMFITYRNEQSEIYDPNPETRS